MHIQSASNQGRDQRQLATLTCLAFSAASSFNADIRDGGVASLYTSLLIAWVCLKVIVETFWITLGSLAFALVVSP
jgi:hypothetical protein